MHPVELLARAITPLPDCPTIPFSPQPGLCAVTGVEGPSGPRAALLGPSFLDGGLLAAPGSDRIGIAAYVAMSYPWARWSSWICDGRSFERLDRAGVRAAVFGPAPRRPWSGYCTTSYKKHGALRAPVNGPGRRVWLFETRVVDTSDRQTVDEFWLYLNTMLNAGYGRTILATLDCPTHVMARCGLQAWIEFEAWARPRYRSALYAFLCYLLPKSRGS